MRDLISRCICSNPSKRPDVAEVLSISEQMNAHFQVNIVHYHISEPSSFFSLWCNVHYFCCPKYYNCNTSISNLLISVRRRKNRCKITSSEARWCWLKHRNCRCSQFLVYALEKQFEIHCYIDAALYVFITSFFIYLFSLYTPSIGFLKILSLMSLFKSYGWKTSVIIFTWY